MAQGVPEPQRAASSGGWLHNSYLASVLFKLGLGIAQMLAAAGLAATSKSQLIWLVAELTAGETQQDPSDPLALWLLAAAQGFSIEAHTFYVIYFAGHGLLNIAIALALLARLRWSYVVSIIVLAGFVGYQVYRFFLTGSPMMIVLSAFDLIIIALVWREYLQERRKRGARGH